MHIVLAAVSILIPVVFVVAVVRWAARNAQDPSRAVGWAAASGLRVTPANQEIVRWFSSLSGTLRAIGAAAGLIVGSLFDDAFGLNTSAGSGFWVWLIVGWVIGGAWAYRCAARTLGGSRPVASLTPRTAADYVPGVIRWGPVVAASVTVAFAVVGASLEPPPQPDPWGVASTAHLLALATVAVLLAAAAWVAIDRIVARRQSLLDPQLVATDDAMRATTIHLIGAGMTAAVLLIAASTVNAVMAPRQMPFGLRGWLPLVLIMTAIVFGRYLPYRSWRVRRSTAASTT